MWQYTPYTLPLAAATILATVVTVLVWRQRESRAEVWGALTQLSIALWALVHLVGISVASFEWQLRWLQLFFPVLALLDVCLLCFTLHYTGRGEWLTPRRTRLLFALPVAVLLVVALAADRVIVDPTLETAGDYAVLEYEWGPVFYAYAAVAYAFNVAYGWLLYLKVRRSRNVYRNLSFVLFASVVVMTAPTLFATAGVSPFPHFAGFPLVYLFIGLVLLAVTVSVRATRMLSVDRALALLDRRSDALLPLARDFVLEGIDNGIVVVDTNGRIVDINATAKRMIGVDRAVGRALTECVHHDRIVDAGDVQPMLDDDAPLREGREEIWVDSLNGRRCYDTTISELTGRAETPAGYVILLHDVTERKRREEALRDRERQLERQRDTLRTQTAKLEHQNEQLDRFAGIVSHDLRNPLNVAKGYLEPVVEETGAADGVSEVDAEAAGDGVSEVDAEAAGDGGGTVAVDVDAVEQVAHSLDRMGAIIDDALALARQGKAITEPEAVTLSTVAREAWENVETGDATLALGGDCDRTIRADPDRLLNVFENLFRNAAEHGGSGVAVSVGVLDDGDGFYVEDDGPGIPADRADEIFEHGYTTNESGTGFGLTIVRDIVRGHGWTIDVRNGEAGGARFEIAGVESPAPDWEASPA